jgi:isoleucyl-tRNA synthetase
MPIEIRELIIKATVNPSTNPINNQEVITQEIKKLKGDVVRDCVKKVLSKLQDHNKKR